MSHHSARARFGVVRPLAMTFHALAVVAILAAGIGIDRSDARAMAAAAPEPAPAPAGGLSEADLEELLAPIALYPDPLLASVLAAAVYPAEITEAWKAVQAGADAAAIDASPWQDPVKSVASAPAVIKLLGENMEWTTAVGEAFVVQSQDVMKAVQALRARAQANGALETTPQQVVTTQGDTIIIQPADPQIIYVPTYNPVVVYAPPSTSTVVATSLISFGVGVAVGCALSCDWNHGCCVWGGYGYHGGYYGGYRGGYADVDVNINRNNNVNINNTNINRNDVNINNENRPRPGQEGAKWEPNQSKMSASLREGNTTALNQYKGAGSGGGGARVPGVAPGSKPIASNPAPRPSTRPAGAGGRTSGSRPDGAPSRPGGAGAAAPKGTPMPRPSASSGAGDRASSGAAPKAQPTPRNVPTPKASPDHGSRPTVPSAPKAGSRGGTPSAFGGGGGSAAKSRGAASRGGASHGGGGRKR